MLKNSPFNKILIIFVLLMLYSCYNKKPDTEKEKNKKESIVKPIRDINIKSIPFRIVDNRIIVKIIINDSINANLLFDNGWGENEGKLSISSSFVKKNLKNTSLVTNNKMKIVTRLPEVGINIYSDYSKDSLNMFLGSRKEKINGFLIYNDSLLLSSTNYDGIINLFDLISVKENILELNFEKKFLLIIPRDGFEPKNDYQLLPFNILGNNSDLILKLPFSLIDCKQDTINLSGDYLFDTGNPDAVIFKLMKDNYIKFDEHMRKMCKSLKTDYYFMKSKNRFISVYKSKKYSLFKKNKYFSESILLYFSNNINGNYDAILPLNLIKNYNYYFDFVKKVVYFKRIEKNYNELEPVVWKFQVLNGKYILRLLKKDSKIEKLGINCGDTILSINNHRLSFFNMDSLKHLVFIQDSIIIKYKINNAKDTLTKLIYLK